METVEELRAYFHNKYPNLDINIWEKDGKYLGKIEHHPNASLNSYSIVSLNAPSISELIDQIECFLRSVT